MNLLSRGLLTLSTLVFLIAPASGKDLVVAQVAPFSGPQAVTGKAIHAGARLYFDQVNAEGGIGGARIRFETRDDAQQPAETVRLTKEVVQQLAPVALIGTVGTSNLQAVINDGVLVRAGLPLVGAVSGASGVVGGRNVFVVKASYHDEVNRLFASLAALQVTRLGLVIQDDSLGADVSAGAEAAAGRNGVVISARAAYARNTTEVAPAVQAMLQARPQTIFLGATTAAAIEFVRQYRAQGGDATLYGMSIIDSKQLLDQLGPELARGYAFSAVLPLESQTTLELVREYLRVRQKSTDPDLSARSIEGFVAAKVLVTALRAVASENRAEPTPAAVLRALQSMRRADMGGYVLDFSQPGRSASTHVDFAMFGSGGKVVH